MDDRAVINPQAGKNKNRLGTVAVMVATQPDLNHLARGLEFTPKDSRSFFSSAMYTRTQDNRGFSLIGPFIGAPHGVMILENLICQGVSRVIFVGWCGSVSPDACIGDILLPSGAFSDEGTSRHYGLTDPSACVEPDGELQGLVDGAFRDQGLPFKRGSVWTTDAIYRETPEKIDHYRNLGALAVDMELSAFYTAAAFRGIQMASALVVSDEVWTHTWKPGFGDKRFKQSRKDVTRVIEGLVERIMHG